MCQNCGDLEVVEKMTAFRRGRLVYLSQFFNKCDFSHHLQMTQIFLHMVTHMAMKENLEKEYFTMPLEV